MITSRDLLNQYVMTFLKISFLLRHAKLTCQKRYLAKKSRKHAVYGIFLYPKLGVSLKDIFRLFQALVRS